MFFRLFSFLGGGGAGVIGSSFFHFFFSTSVACRPMTSLILVLFFTRLTPYPYLYMKRGMVLRAFIIIRNYNHSIIIQAKTRTTSYSTFANVFNISQQQHSLSTKL